MADESQALVPVRQQTVDFYGDQVSAAQVADGTIWVPVRPLCEELGLDWSSQAKRLRRDPVLGTAQGMVIMTTPGGAQAFVALPLKLLPGWLFGITTNKVRPELRERVRRYQADCYEVLWRAFQADILPEPVGSGQWAVGSDAGAGASGAALALEIAEAVATLARQHLDLERRHQVMAEYLRPFIQQTERRLTALELRLEGGATIGEAEAQALQQAVKQLAMALHTATGQPVAQAFQLVWGELYKRYRVGAYRNLPAARYGEALAWLEGWYGELSGEGQGST